MSIKKIIQKEAGFTLMEAILSLLVLGIMGAVVGFGFSMMAQVYINNTNMVTVTTKSEVAMERLRKELLHVSAINAGSSTSVSFTTAEATHNTHIISYYAPGVDGPTGTLKFDVDGDALTTTDNFKMLDEIQSFSFTYYDDYTDTAGSTTWTTGTSRLIGISLTMMPTKGSTNVFNYETRMMPRNL